MTSAMTIPMLAELAGRAALILALSWIGARLAFRRSASTRYAVWAAGFIAALALPIATGVLPSWHLAVLPPQDAPATALSRPLDMITRTAASSAASTPPTSLAPTEATDQKETAAVARPAQAPSTVPSTPLPWALIGWAANRRGPRRAVCGQPAGGALDHAAGSTLTIAAGAMRSTSPPRCWASFRRPGSWHRRESRFRSRAA